MDKLATSRIYGVNDVDVQFVRRRVDQFRIRIQLRQTHSAMTAKIRRDRILLTTTRTFKRQLTTGHRDKVTLIAFQNFQVANDELPVERYGTKGAQTLAQRIAIN